MVLGLGKPWKGCPRKSAVTLPVLARRAASPPPLHPPRAGAFRGPLHPTTRNPARFLRPFPRRSASGRLTNLVPVGCTRRLAALDWPERSLAPFRIPASGLSRPDTHDRRVLPLEPRRRFRSPAPSMTVFAVNPAHRFAAAPRAGEAPAPRLKDCECPAT